MSTCSAELEAPVVTSSITAARPMLTPEMQLPSSIPCRWGARIKVDLQLVQSLTSVLRRWLKADGRYSNCRLSDLFWLTAGNHAGCFSSATCSICCSNQVSECTGKQKQDRYNCHSHA